MLCTNCCGKSCSANDLCFSCHDRTGEKLAIQQEKKDKVGEVFLLFFFMPLLTCCFVYSLI